MKEKVVFLSQLHVEPELNLHSKPTTAAHFPGAGDGVGGGSGEKKAECAIIKD